MGDCGARGGMERSGTSSLSAVSGRVAMRAWSRSYRWVVRVMRFSESWRECQPKIDILEDVCCLLTTSVLPLIR
jgi:hypothetical protein